MNKLWKVLILVLCLTAVLCAAASAEKATEISRKCKYKVSSGSATKIHDDRGDFTIWKPEGGKGEARVKLADGAHYIEIGWGRQPKDYTVTEYDGTGNVLVTHTPQTDDLPCLRMLYELNDETKYVFASFDQENQGICNVRVFTAGTLPSTVVKWVAGPEKCDLMVISTHQDDEWLWFGAMIPYYQLVQHKNVQVVYSANCGRGRYGEALSAIASTGMNVYPLFLGLKDERINSLTQTVNDWGGKEKVREIFANVFRRYRPDVILTHDWNGEYGHNQHKVTSRIMQYAIEAAADETIVPVTEYDTWQVSKLYRHLEKKGKIQFDWHKKYEEFGGRTGLQVAKDAMAQNASQTAYYSVKDHGEYDNTLFGLSWSNVGDDKEHKDLFENVVVAEPTPAPTEEPQGTEPPDTTGIVLQNPLVGSEEETPVSTALPPLAADADDAEEASEAVTDGEDAFDTDGSEAVTDGENAFDTDGSEAVSDGAENTAGTDVATEGFIPQRVDEKKGSPVGAILLSVLGVAVIGGGAAGAVYMKRRAEQEKRRRRRRRR